MVAIVIAIGLAWNISAKHSSDSGSPAGWRSAVAAALPVPAVRLSAAGARPVLPDCDFNGPHS
jgi:hypothetical protein